MSFAFREVVISGSRPDTEGSARGIQELTTAMETMGWTIHDDRTAQPSPNHKMVLYNNQGEDATASGIYMVLTSGTNDEIGVQVSTGWNASTHVLEGVYSPLTAGPTSIQTDEDATYMMWVAGDKDAIAVFTKTEDIYTGLVAGRAVPFMDTDYEPYGVYVRESFPNSPVIPATSPVYGLVGTTPTAITTSNQASIIFPGTFGTADEPRTALQHDWEDVVFTALPMIFMVDIDNDNKGAIGFVKHLWYFLTATNTGVHSEVIWVDQVTGMEYMTFASTSTMVLRRS